MTALEKYLKWDDAQQTLAYHRRNAAMAITDAANDVSVFSVDEVLAKDDEPGYDSSGYREAVKFILERARQAGACTFKGTTCVILDVESFFHVACRHLFR